MSPAKLEPTVIHTLEWLAAEYSSLVDLEKELEEINRDANLLEKEKKIKKALRILKVVGRAERRANAFEDRTKKALKALAKKLYREVEKSVKKPKRGYFAKKLSRRTERLDREVFLKEQFHAAKFNVADHLADHVGWQNKRTFQENLLTPDKVIELVKEIEVERRTILKFTSRYPGELRKDLLTVDHLALLEEKVDNKEEIETELEEALLQVEKKTKLVIKWVKAAEATMESIKKLIKSQELNYKRTLKDEGMAILENAGFNMKEHVYQKLAEELSTRLSFLRSFNEKETIAALRLTYCIRYSPDVEKFLIDYAHKDEAELRQYLRIIQWFIDNGIFHPAPGLRGCVSVKELTRKIPRKLGNEDDVSTFFVMFGTSLHELTGLWDHMNDQTFRLIMDNFQTFIKLNRTILYSLNVEVRDRRLENEYRRALKILIDLTNTVWDASLDEVVHKWADLEGAKQWKS